MWEGWNFGDLYWTSCNSSNVLIPRLVMCNTWNLLLDCRNLCKFIIRFCHFCFFVYLHHFDGLMLFLLCVAQWCPSVGIKFIIGCNFLAYDSVVYIDSGFMHVLGDWLKRRAVIGKPRLCSLSYVEWPKHLIDVQRHDSCYVSKLSPHRNLKILTKKEINFYITITRSLYICLSSLHTISVNAVSRIS
jgi:hypothetical protein